MCAEINKREIERTVQRTSETNAWSFKKIKKIDKHLLNLTARQRKNIQINTI